MKKEKNGKKKLWWAAIICICIVVVLLATIGVPLLINWVFTIPAKCDLFAVNWEAKDALAYYGSALGFIGTVIFSGLALWQNHVIQKANDAHTALLEQMEREKNSPRIIVEAVSSGRGGNIKLLINNISDNIAHSVVASGFSIIDETGNTVWSNAEEIKTEYLFRGRVWPIQLKNPQVKSKLDQFVFEIQYRDPFDSECTDKIIGTFIQNENHPTFKVTRV